MIQLYRSEKNLVLCGNHEFIIKVDLLHNQKLRYLCWKRPKTILDMPDLILLNGIMQPRDGHEVFEVIFKYMEFSYTVEKIKTTSTTHIFVEITKGNSYSKTLKMRNMQTVDTQLGNIWILG
ncbi:MULTISPECIES: hypothetical protein [Flavobacteriaceae]|uniref:hypothetical protein n=1 Tax=Flavobacteriaceae TaxID=49546 RepID=UPI0014932074|nr:MULTISPECIES: hypothetical protein [Allomuricauda]MDC6364721.1 hypothetical protein [Muricauda sp. AC10]